MAECFLKVHQRFIRATLQAVAKYQVGQGFGECGP